MGDSFHPFSSYWLAQCQYSYMLFYLWYFEMVHLAQQSVVFSQFQFYILIFTHSIVYIKRYKHINHMYKCICMLCIYMCIYTYTHIYMYSVLWIEFSLLTDTSCTYRKVYMNCWNAYTINFSLLYLWKYQIINYIDIMRQRKMNSSLLVYDGNC